MTAIKNPNGSDPLKVDSTLFTSLTFATTINWDAQNKDLAGAGVIATGNFTLNITNLKAGPAGKTIAVTSNVATSVTVGFTGTGLTFKQGAVNPLISYTLPVGTGRTYYFTLINNGGNVEVFVNDFTSPVIPGGMVAWCDLRQTVAVTQTTVGVYYPMSFNTEPDDTFGMWDISAPTSIVIPGTGKKTVEITIVNSWSSGAGYRRLQVLLNGVSTGQSSAETVTTGLTWPYQRTATFNAQGGDIVRIEGQASVAALTFTGSVYVKVFNSIPA